MRHHHARAAARAEGGAGHSFETALRTSHRLARSKASAIMEKPAGSVNSHRTIALAAMHAFMLKVRV
jgi:hypothetical protein